MDINMDRADAFKEELTSLINKHSMENFCDVPDFLLAEMLTSYIMEFGVHMKRNLDWHGCDSVCHQAQLKKELK